MLRPRRRGRRPRTRHATMLALVGWLALGVAGARVDAQAHADPATTSQSHAADGSAENHGESWGAVLSRLANFAILVGGLWYFLRSPMARYLDGRSTDIRDAIEHAEELKARAAAQVATIEARLRELPGEVEALRKRGVAEIKAEEERIRRAAEDERVRLLDQMRRQIELQLQAALRDLRREAADLAVKVAANRVAVAINDSDQRRLISRYISQVRDVA